MTSALKKTLYAAEQKRAEVARARRRWMREQGLFARRDWYFSTRPPPTPRWCGFVAAVGVATDWSITHRTDIGKTITFVAGLRQRGMTAPFVHEGAMNGPMFLVYVRQCLVPTLSRGDIIVMDNLPVHKVAGVAEAIAPHHSSRGRLTGS
jgi:hypothetical protein